MIVIAAVIGAPTGVCAATLDSVSTGDVRLATSDAQFSELSRVFKYESIERKIDKLGRVFDIALEVGYMGTKYQPRCLDWPSLRDQKDSWIFDLAYEASVDCIVSYDWHVTEASKKLGFICIQPETLLKELRKS